MNNFSVNASTRDNRKNEWFLSYRLRTSSFVVVYRLYSLLRKRDLAQQNYSKIYFQSWFFESHLHCFSLLHYKQTRKKIYLPPGTNFRAAGMVLFLSIINEEFNYFEIPQNLCIFFKNCKI